MMRGLLKKGGLLDRFLRAIYKVINKNYCIKENKYWHLAEDFSILKLFYVHVPVGSCLGKYKGFVVSNFA